MKTFKKKYRCSGCDKIVPVSQGKFVRWSKQADESYKVCCECLEVIRLFKMKTVEDLRWKGCGKP